MAGESRVFADPVPLVVDLDGTLIHEESHQRFWSILLRQKPLRAAQALCVLACRGRLAFKRFSVYHARFSPTSWTVRADLYHWLAEEKKRGRQLILATGAPRLAVHLVLEKGMRALFSEFWTSVSSQNFVGTRKAARLCARFGPRGFDYVGNSVQDIPVWRLARFAYLVKMSPVRTWWLKWRAGCALLEIR